MPRNRILTADATELGFTRAQISERAIEIAESIAKGSYKNAILGIGKMVSLSECIVDGYWSEKFEYGRTVEEYYLNSGMKDGHPDKNITIN